MLRVCSKVLRVEHMSVEVTDSDKTHSLTSCIKICSCEKFYGQDKLENVREKIFFIWGAKCTGTWTKKYFG